MSTYIHHLPGRLRVRAVLLKNSETKAAEARAALNAVPGVILAETSTVTGSITVTYDSDRVAAQDLLRLLCAQGLVRRLPSAADDPAERLGDRIGQAAVSFCVEKLLERSAATLLAALL